MSAPDLSTTAEDGGIPEPGLRKDLPPQSLSVPSEADSDIAAIAGPSQQAERHGTGSHSPHPIADIYLACGRENAVAVDIENDRSLCAFESDTWVTDTYRDVCTRAAKRAGRQARHLEYPEEHEDSEWVRLGSEDCIELEELVNVEDGRIGQGPWLPACDAGSSGWMPGEEGQIVVGTCITISGHTTSYARRRTWQGWWFPAGARCVWCKRVVHCMGAWRASSMKNGMRHERRIGVRNWTWTGAISLVGCAAYEPAGMDAPSFEELGFPRCNEEDGGTTSKPAFLVGGEVESLRMRIAGAEVRHPPILNFDFQARSRNS
ncbi:hypothetical protein EDB84DRAFT_1676117 [Lactarius hengduanensis]|nr:hypothetical protein EDB84DRAFT_1676117 [Lactarius hengduanensis]